MNKITVNINDSILRVLKVMDKAGIGFLTVLDQQEKVVGVLTDGDIRRGFIKGYQLDDTVSCFLNREFYYLVEDNIDLKKFGEYRTRRLRAVPLLSKERKLLRIYDFTTTKSILPVDAVIMAGGLGSRLRPLTNDTPKPLLKIGGKEIIAYNFDRLHQYGIENQHITVKYLAEQIEEFCNNYPSDINFSLVYEKEYMGTAGALSLIDDFKNDTILLMNSDLLTNIDYEDFYRSFIEKDADIMVASIPYDVSLPYAIFDTHEREVLSFKEKPNFTYYANAGLYLIKKEVLELIPKETLFNATDLLDKVIANDKKLIHYPIRGYWLDIGKHKDFDKAMRDIAHINWD